MNKEEKEKQIKILGRELLYYLENYNELTRVRPRFKKVIDKEINEIVKQMKALSR